MNQDEREIYDRLRRLVDQNSAVAITVRTEDLKVMLNSYAFIDSEAKVAMSVIGLQLKKAQEDAARYQFLKAHCGERDLDGGYTLHYVFPVLDRDNGEKKMPIDRRYFNDIDACVDYHRKKA